VNNIKTANRIKDLILNFTVEQKQQLIDSGHLPKQGDGPNEEFRKSH